MEDDLTEADRRIQELDERIKGLREKCLTRSAMRVAREMKRVAKAERRLIPYLMANFYLMNDCQSTMEPDEGVEAAIENIAMLESEEKARQFQADFPEQEYYHTVYWMSACAYDNLGTHVAARDGYNSDGVHDVIQEGIEVCRRTGKVACITCFREYATDVFREANDLDLAMHHARLVATSDPADERNDRRMCGAQDMTKLLLIQGQLGEARRAAVETLRLAGTYHNPLSARVDTTYILGEIAHLSGGGDAVDEWLSEADGALDPSLVPPEGEHPKFDLLRAKRDAVASCCGKDFAKAADLLSGWDQRLTRQNALDEWMEVRLRLVAVHVLSGDRARAEALAAPLRERAGKARAWMILKRLDGLLDGSVPPSPVPFLAPATCGPFAPAQAQAPPAAVPAAAGPEVGPSAPPAEGEPEATPLAAMADRVVERWRRAEGSEEVFSQTLNEIMAVDLDQVDVAEDGARLIYLAGYAARVVDRTAEAWRWAEPFSRRFPQHGTTLNVLADLGHAARTAAGEGADQIVPAERIESLFRASLDLDHERARNFARAGFFYLDVGRKGDAERCLARASCLDRTDSGVNLSLAELYADSDRPRDALAVLDLCLREGCDDPRVAWQAGLTALQLDRYDEALTYFDRVEAQDPGQPWVQYYRAWCLLEKGRADEGLAAVDLEQSRCEWGHFHLDVLRAWAHGLRSDAAEFRRQLAVALEARLAVVDYLSASGLKRLMGKLYEASTCLAPDAPEHASLRQRLVESGLAPEDLFQPDRNARPVAEGLNYYVCRVRQPLDERWPQWPGCLSGQGHWTEYVAYWGVLAPDPDEAAALTLAEQAECYPLPSELLDCEQQGNGFQDSPGIVWQGVREPVGDENA